MSEQPLKFVDTIPNVVVGRWSTTLAHVEFAQALRANPLRWAEFKRSASAAAALLELLAEQYDDEAHAVIEYDGSDPECDEDCPACHRNEAANAVAGAILGEDPME